jgi:hypothetical protein
MREAPLKEAEIADPASPQVKILVPIKTLLLLPAIRAL